MNRKIVPSQASKGLVKPAMILSVSTFVAKLVGALYRIPLTNLIGVEGLGLYQMIFPVYCILLDFSGAGVPSALSKMLAERDRVEGNKTFAVALRFFAVLGVIASLLMALLAYPLAFLQGNTNAYKGYLLLSPAVFFVSVLSCYRGFFQGGINVTPTAISQVVEQLSKLVFGLAFAYLFLPNISLAVGGATLGVTLSEIVAFALVIFLYKKANGRLFPQRVSKVEKREILPKILKCVIPVTVIGIAMPIAHLSDSFIIVNVLSKYRQDATSLYGILSGTVCSIINLPVAICYGVAVVVIPMIAGCKNNGEVGKKSLTGIAMTLALSVPCAVGLFTLANPVIKILFHSLTNEQFELAVRLLKLCSVNVVLSSLLQTVNALLIGRGKSYNALVGLGAGTVVRIVCNLVLLPIQSINIYGGGIASIACNLVATLINLIQVFAVGKRQRLNKRLSVG